ncbi:hypothetical protein M569_12532 [Genlisea aurea]|uniref:Uncharacterized protein n=1 Tax=Genlisea aurea TaxID=192259 RepID=S8C676_9LAMI|nr:hypothetical protein M569_12532 [Genlisea aurea]
MDDVITDFPPPSRFLPEDLNNFTPPTPAVTSPVINFSSPLDFSKFSSPSLLIVAISYPSVHFLSHLSSTTPLGTLVLSNNQSCDIVTLNNAATNPITIVLVRSPVPPERAHEVAKLLVGGGNNAISPQSVLILDSIRSCNFRGKLSSDEAAAFKLENGECVVKGVDYYPSGSIADGLGASVLSRCAMKKIRGCLYLSWPDFGLPVMSIVKAAVAGDVLRGVDCSTDSKFEDEYLKVCRKKALLDSDMYA